MFEYAMKNKLENNLLIFFKSLLNEYKLNLIDKKVEER